MTYFSHAKRKIAFTIALVLGVSIAAPTFAFTDVRSSDDFATAINALQEKGIIEGYVDGTFGAGKTINRAEFLKIILEGRAKAQGKTFASNDATCFPDVRNEWFAKYVCAAKSEGIIGGYPDGTFKPDQRINVVEASKILSLAFHQKPAQTGSEWYTPYVRVLESSKALPPSLKGADKNLTRGEMAEMLWRLVEAEQDEDAIGYLNVKYPSLAINTASDDVQRAGSCADLQAFVQEAQISGYGGAMLRDMAVPAMAPLANDAGRVFGESKASGDYSETNVQVAGVDEADTVKTDGESLFVVRGNTVVLTDVHDPENLRLTSTIDFSEENFTPNELYIDGDTLVVLGTSWTPYPGSVYPMEKMDARLMIWPPYQSSKATVKTYDVASRSAPALTRTVSFDGSTLSSRRIDDELYLVVNENLWWRGPMPLMDNVRASATDVLPTFQDSAKGSASMPVTDCAKIAILPHVPSPSYLIVASIPLDDADAEVQREVILGSAENMYLSPDNLYLAASEWNYRWDGSGDNSVKTRLYRFALNGGKAMFAKEGTVNGTVLNQFSMDENDGIFRVATTEDAWTMNGTQSLKNHLFLLNQDMQTVGRIEDIAPGERIYSVRFMDDRAYVVTFRTIDPLFVIDVGDARNPRILGQLKIPGYSNYLHPYDDDDLILGFGKDAVASKDNTFAWYQGMKVAMFDVSDVKNPKELHAMSIGDRGTDSPLLFNHKALLFDRARNLLAFPITVAKIPDYLKQGNDGSAYGSPIFQGAHVYDVSEDDGFDLRGTITHYPADTWTKAGDVWYGGDRDVQRILRVGDSLLTVSPAAIGAHTLSGVDEEDTLELPVITPVNGGRVY